MNGTDKTGPVQHLNLCGGADSEQRPTRMYPAASILKDSKMVHYREKSTDRGQLHLPRNRSWRLKMRRRSNSVSGMCILPSIPEYPGFQDMKQRNYSRGCLSTGQCKSKSSFCDTTLQDYFNERFLELRNYDKQKSNGKMKDYLDENQKPSIASRGLRRRNSCNAAMQGKVTADSSGSVGQADDRMMRCGNGHSYPQNSQGSNKGNYLESLAMSINGPLEMLVQRNWFRSVHEA